MSNVVSLADFSLANYKMETTSHLAPTAELILGDALTALRNRPDQSVDLFAIDPPYGTTSAGWDSVIPMDELWTELRRVVTPTGVIVMTAAQPFTSMLVTAAPDLFKFSMVWKKNRPTGHLNSGHRPMVDHEDILVFSKGMTGRSRRRMTYNPQGMVELAKPIKSRNGGTGTDVYNGGPLSPDLGRLQTVGNHPRSVLEFDVVHKTVHPTQKPVDLFDYLIRTFSNPGETVMDVAMGSGTTGVAALAAGRSFIGVEMDPAFFQISEDRINGPSRVIAA